ncbi:hypothetical protein H5410_030755 [Solanum commersonii]|uniref:Uncharacterized protein n=1 Tax=Solanum commersonii TaxID=4109 RepID=A0A9J5YGM1_SOLCO|nr:hypothetical protein H5410_030755 [Solanum commersonii]
MLPLKKNFYSLSQTHRIEVQVVDIERSRESPKKKYRFQNLILEDEEKCHIRTFMYADGIEQYEDELTLMDTYLISTARVKVCPTSYRKSIHKFYLFLDKKKW